MVSFKTFKSSKDSSRTDKRMCANKLDYSNIEFSVNIEQNNQIEKQNNINAFGYEKETTFSNLYISKEKFIDQPNLLLITDDKKALCAHKRF